METRVRVELRDAGLRYGDHAPLFEGVDLLVEGGDFIVVEGASGCGKSSLLRLLNRLQEPTTGSLEVGGVECDDVPALRRRVLLVPQTPVAVPGSVADNLRYPFAFRASRDLPMPGDAELRALLDTLLLDDVGLDEDAAPLSVGQRQRLSLARALPLQPAILLCDEPTSALDPDARGRVEAILEARCAAGAGVVMVSHLPFVPGSVPARRLRLHAGGLDPEGD